MGKRNRAVNALDLIKCEKILAIYTENYEGILRCFKEELEAYLSEAKMI